MRRHTRTRICFHPAAKRLRILFFFSYIYLSLALTRYGQKPKYDVTEDRDAPNGTLMQRPPTEVPLLSYMAFSVGFMASNASFMYSRSPMSSRIFQLSSSNTPLLLSSPPPPLPSTSTSPDTCG
ncbi:hypothetical protein TraAM80_01545 [Trypanosoma rangeli]|uniref:Uncharacterized protein n=1 Tax=Trypanosoma rangeli TaxID=5698 RepID=A0A3R7KMQ1_TRYRA|nr:uncharacterized protein TraAM80_01545 [Trypanosoma rangeli]RNF10498.1 hypothetical protein TraAM80_01545 [Trypanosoma rangeli]|eukprot:RNF10498.1 hypothetical protein TraAM80_01545 [Trypanosoma rangeli]